MAMTEGSLRQLCKANNLYRTPSLNEVLYCNNQGFTQLGGLEEYTALRALFLEGNALTDLEGLPSCELACLYVQSNCLSSLVGLSSVPQLKVLDVSSNELSSLRGLKACPQLNTLNCAKNVLATAESLKELQHCQKLETLDIQSNKLQDAQVMEVVKALPGLRSLYIKGNPFLSAVRHSRKTLIGSIPLLTYLDTKPVTDAERACAEAWLTTGPEAEQQTKKKIRQAMVDKEKENFDALQATRRESFRKQRAAANLPQGDTDPFYDTVDDNQKEADEPAELVTAQLNLAKLSSPADESKHISAEDTFAVHGDDPVAEQEAMPVFDDEDDEGAGPSMEGGGSVTLEVIGQKIFAQEAWDSGNHRVSSQSL